MYDLAMNYVVVHPESAYNKEVRRVREELSDYSETRVALQQMTGISEGEREEQLLKLDQAVTMYAGLMMEEFYKALDRDHRENQAKSVLEKE